MGNEFERLSHHKDESDGVRDRFADLKEIFGPHQTSSSSEKEKTNDSQRRGDSIDKSTLPLALFDTPSESDLNKLKTETSKAVEAIVEAARVNPDYLQKLLESRTSRPSGSRYENMTPDDLLKAMYEADWVESPHPNVADGATRYTARIKGGILGIAPLSAIPEDAPLSLVDPKGTGAWSLTTNGKVDVRAEVTTLIIGPGEDANGEPIKANMIRTVHPGDPFKPSTTTTTTNETLMANGVTVPDNLPKDGEGRRIPISRKQAESLGLDLVKMENEPKETGTGSDTKRKSTDERNAESDTKAQSGTEKASTPSEWDQLQRDKSNPKYRFIPSNGKGDGVDFWVDKETGQPKIAKSDGMEIRFDQRDKAMQITWFDSKDGSIFRRMHTDEFMNEEHWAWELVEKSTRAEHFAHTFDTWKGAITIAPENHKFDLSFPQLGDAPSLYADSANSKGKADTVESNPPDFFDKSTLLGEEKAALAKLRLILNPNQTENRAIDWTKMSNDSLARSIRQLSVDSAPPKDIEKALRALTSTDKGKNAREYLFNKSNTTTAANRAPMLSQQTAKEVLSIKDQEVARTNSNSTNLIDQAKQNELALKHTIEELKTTFELSEQKAKELAPKLRSAEPKIREQAGNELVHFVESSTSESLKVQKGPAKETLEQRRERTLSTLTRNVTGRLAALGIVSPVVIGAFGRGGTPAQAPKIEFRK